MNGSVIGIDVGKNELVLYWDEEFISLENEEKALKNFYKKYERKLREVKLVVYEATGGYEKELHRFLEAKKLPYRRVHANHVRAYAKAKGILCKTDKVDAKVLSDFGVKMELTPKAMVSESPELKVLLSRREQLIDMRLQERNRLETSEKLLKVWIEKNIKQLSKQIEAIEKAMNHFIKANPRVEKLLGLYSSIPGIGKITSLQLIVDLPELLEANDKVLAALVGLAPWNHDSGTKVGRRRTRGGRVRIRSLLYMASLVAVRCNPQIKAFYLRLKQKGKATKVVLIAVAHKLLGILRSVAQRQTPWVPTLAI